jgi:uncharacterized protein (TIGR02268 family)
MTLMPVASLLPLIASGGPLSALPLPDCPATLRVDVRATTPALPPVACLSPGEFTNLRLDSALILGEQGLVVEGAGRSLPVDRGTHGISFFLPDDFPTGGRYQVTLRFSDSNAPANATLELVVHPSLVTHQVRLYRHERSAVELLQAAKAAWAEALQCKEEKAHLQAACTAGVGLRALLSGEPPTPESFKSVDMSDLATAGKRNALQQLGLFAYRLKEEVVLAVKLENPGNEAWLAAGATLTTPKGEQIQVVQVLQENPIAPCERGWALIALAPGSTVPEGPLTLTLWAEGGARTVSLGNLTLP